jgi:hypothetical protein
MKALLLFESRRIFRSAKGRVIVMAMDLYELPASESQGAQVPYRFSWIAFDRDAPDQRVLFDSHPPKGPHFHLDGDDAGQSFVWVSISEAVALFERKVTERFGELLEESDDEGEKK